MGVYVGGDITIKNINSLCVQYISAIKSCKVWLIEKDTIHFHPMPIVRQVNILVSINKL